MRGGILLFATACILAISGCASDAARPDERSGAPVPEFEGPWAAELAEAWTATDSEFVHDVLRDGVVTDAEFAENTERFGTCLESRGLIFEGFDPTGGYGVKFDTVRGEAAQTVMDECEVESGQRWIGFIHFNMADNPSNTPSEEIISACLVRNGAVDPSYGLEDYLRDVDTLSFPYIVADGEEIFFACNEDFDYVR